MTLEFDFDIFVHDCKEFWHKQVYMHLLRFFLVKVEDLTQMGMNYHAWYMFREKRDLGLPITKRLEL